MCCEKLSLLSLTLLSVVQVPPSHPSLLPLHTPWVTIHTHTHTHGFLKQLNAGSPRDPCLSFLSAQPRPHHWLLTPHWLLPLRHLAFNTSNMELLAFPSTAPFPTCSSITMMAPPTLPPKPETRVPSLTSPLLQTPSTRSQRKLPGSQT